MATRRAPTFVNREHELKLLREAYCALEDRPATLVIEGEPGIGKTALLDEFQHWVELQGGRVLRGSGVRVHGAELPFVPFASALRDAALNLEASWDASRPLAPRANLARPRPRPVGEIPGPSDASPLAQLRLFEAVHDHLEELATRAPLVLAFDDGHLLDRSSMDLLEYLVRSEPVDRLLVCVAMRASREPHRSPFVLDLVTSRGGQRVHLGPLSDVDASRLVTAVLPDSVEERAVRRLVGRAEGNPLFLKELCAHRADQSPGALPATLRELLGQRIDLLSPAARRAALVVAMAGGAAQERLIATAGSLEEPELLSALREAVEAGVIAMPVAGDDPYRLHHGLIREVIEANLLPAERRTVHLAIARAVEAERTLGGRTSAEQTAALAAHWDAAGRPLEALHASLEASDSALAEAAFAEAAAQLRRAAALWTLVPAGSLPPMDRAALLERTARAEYLSGDPDAAARFVGEALEALEPGSATRRGLLSVQLGSYLSAGGHDDAARRALAVAVELLPAEPPTEDRARAMVGLGATLMLLGRHDDSLQVVRSALDACRQLGARALEAQALNFLGVDLVRLGRSDEGIGILREAVAMSDDRDPVALLEACNNLAVMLGVADRTAEAAGIALQGVEVAAQRRLDRLSGAVLRVSAGHLLYRLGRWTEAERLLDDGIALNPPREPAIGLHRDRARIRIARGQADEAAADLRAADRLAEDARRPEILAGLALATAELAMVRGRPGEALDVVERIVAALGDQPDTATVTAELRAAGVRAAADGACAARARGRAGEVDALLARGRRLLAGVGQHACRHHDEARAELGRLEGRPDPDAWASLARDWDAVAEPYRAAYCRMRLAETRLAAPEHRASGIAELRIAASAALELGAQPLSEMIAAVGRRARVDIEVRRRPVGAAPGLTAREMDVLTLIAAGRTNPQIAQALFISPKTAGIHVSNILGKLGVPSRADAAAIAGRLGIHAEGPVVANEPATCNRTYLVLRVADEPAARAAFGADTWTELVRRHDVAARRIVAAGGGVELERNGDELLVAFADATAAIEAAVDVQRALADQRRSERLAASVAAGVHQGRSLRVDGHVTGPGIDDARRIAGLAAPNEILASAPTIEAATAATRARARSIGDLAPGQTGLVTIGW